MELVNGIEHVCGSCRPLPGIRFLVTENLDSAKYNFVMAIECCIDIGNHIIASEGLRVPADYRDVARVLAGSDIISHDLSGKFKLMIAFRNRLVHIC